MVESTTYIRLVGGSIPSRPTVKSIRCIFISYVRDKKLMQEIKKCLKCSLEFNSKTVVSRYCSSRCYKSAKSSRHYQKYKKGIKICLLCNNEYLASNTK